MKPYSDPSDPDFIAMYRYTDLDALFELHGHLRAANPTTQVNFRLAHELSPMTTRSNMVALGGVDWNRRPAGSSSASSFPSSRSEAARDGRSRLLRGNG